MAGIQFLVRELRFCKPCGAAKKKKIKLSLRGTSITHAGPPCAGRQKSSKGASKMPAPTPGTYTALLGEAVLSHLTDEETEAQREGVTCPGATGKRQS